MTEARMRPDQALILLALNENTIRSVGPHGEPPTSARDVELTYAERKRLNERGATAAIVMHYVSDWSQAQVEGMQAGFARLGIEVVAVTEAGFRADRQVENLATVMAKRPDVIVSIPTDPAATADAYRAAAAAGTKLVFIDNVPDGFVAGTDYVSVVAADNYGNGVASAHLMAQALGGEGTVGLVHHQADFFVTRQRAEAFEATIAQDYPGMRVVARHGVTGPDFAADAESGVAAMLASHPDVRGIWAVWDVPAKGVLVAARAASRADLAVTTIDLGLDAAVELASGGLVKGVGAQRPYDAGVTEALLAGYALLGKDAPPFVALPALPVTQNNVLAAWEEIYRQPPPPALGEASMSPA
ncbi:MAG: substrate-binding domain-containing protein, partial [Candidatus Limnocylindria bacterium]